MGIEPAQPLLTVQNGGLGYAPATDRRQLPATTRHEADVGIDPGRPMMWWIKMPGDAWELSVLADVGGPVRTKIWSMIGPDHFFTPERTEPIMEMLRDHFGALTPPRSDPRAPRSLTITW